MSLPSYPKMVENLTLGDLLKYEAPNLYSREQAHMAAGQKLSMGAILGKVTATEKLKELDPDAVDGTEIAIGVLGVDVDATLIDSDYGFYIARHSMVATIALKWPSGITALQKTTAIKQLETRGILVRTSA